jgi:hypothetical protein
MYLKEKMLSNIQCLRHPDSNPVAEFIDLDWEGKVNSDLALSYQPARLHGLAGRYGNPMPELTLSPIHGYMNSASR